jgi:integrin beta 3
MTIPELGALLQGLAPAIRDYVHTTIKSHSDRLSALETQDLIPGRDGERGPAGEPGRPGKDGADGVGFDDLQFSYDGERTITFRFTKGARVVDKTFTMPMLIYRGVYDAERTYESGDQVTCAGSTWVAKARTTQRPDDDGPGARDWTLCSKRGPVGQRGPKGDPGTTGKDGASGRDLTQMDTTGRKW